MLHLPRLDLGHGAAGTIPTGGTVCNPSLLCQGHRGTWGDVGLSPAGSGGLREGEEPTRRLTVQLML